MATFGERLRELIAETGVRQKDLCIMLDVSKVTMSRWVHGTQEPSQEEGFAIYDALADFFNVPLSYIIGVSDDRKVTKEDEDQRNEDTANQAQRDERMHYQKVLGMLRNLSPTSRAIVEGTLVAAYRVDEQRGVLLRQLEEAEEAEENEEPEQSDES